jgi:hypothetical protein
MVFPIFFGPLWANYGHLYGLWAGIYGALVSAFLFVYLFNIAKHLEDPLSEAGLSYNERLLSAFVGVDHINIYIMNEVIKHHLFDT